MIDFVASLPRLLPLAISWAESQEVSGLSAFPTRAAVQRNRAMQHLDRLKYIDLQIAESRLGLG
jgi:hypothetical protein